MKKRMLCLLAVCCLLTLLAAPLTLFAAESGDVSVDTDYNRRAAALDETYAYTAYDLGATCIDGATESTIFRLWAPTATEVKVSIYEKATEEEGGAKYGTFAMEKQTESGGEWKSGVWTIRLVGNWVDLYYQYEVTVGDSVYSIADPYSREIGRDGGRTRIVALESSRCAPENWASDTHVYFDSHPESTVYRLNVANFTAGQGSGADGGVAGKYLGLAEEGTTLRAGYAMSSSGIDYLKQLGITAVELDGFCSPYNMMSPDVNLSASTRSDNDVIRECRTLIQTLHAAGISVILRLPAAFTENDNNSFRYAVPDYYYRLNAAGERLDGSGYGNEFATERRMYRHYLITTLLGWVEQYHVDGFSFEQSALLDTDTMSAVREALDGVSPRLVTFADGTCHKENAHPETTYTGAAFARVRKDNAKLLPDSLIFAPGDATPLYAEIAASLGISATVRDEGAVRRAKLAAGLLAVSRGVFFINAGDEMCAPAGTGTELNWNNVQTYADVVSYYRGLIRLRAAFPTLLTDGMLCTRDTVLHMQGAQAAVIEAPASGGWRRILLAWNTGGDTAHIPAFADGTWEVVATGDYAGTDSRQTLSAPDALEVAGESLFLAVDTDSYAAAGISSGMASVTVNFVESGTGKVLRPPMILSGIPGTKYSLPDRVAGAYRIDYNGSFPAGVFGEGETELTMYYRCVFDGLGDVSCPGIDFDISVGEGIVSVTLDGAELTMGEDGRYRLNAVGRDVLLCVTGESGASYRMTVTVRQAHAGGAATCTEGATCEVCGRKYGETDAENHTGELRWIRSETGHRRQYSCCGLVTVADAPHTWENGFCTLCSYACIHENPPDAEGRCTRCGISSCAMVTDANGEVTYYLWFDPAWTAAVTKDGAVLTLLRDVHLGMNVLTVTEGRFVLNLGGCTLSTRSAQTLLSVSGTADVTVRGGKLVNLLNSNDNALSLSDAGAVQLTGGTLTLEGVLLSGGILGEGDRTDALKVSAGRLTLRDCECIGMLLLTGTSVGEGYVFPVLSVTSVKLNHGMVYIYAGDAMDVSVIQAILAPGSLLFDGEGKYFDLSEEENWFTQLGLQFFAYEGALSVQPHTHTYEAGVCRVCAYACPHQGGEATCHEKAVCGICGQAYGTLNPDNHAGGTRVTGARAAACTEDGYTGDVRCGGCDTILTAGAAIPATGHKGGRATCHEKAVCGICGQAYGALNPDNHAALAHIPAVASTAAVAGHTDYHHCAACGRYFSDGTCREEITLADTVLPKLPPRMVEGEGAARKKNSKEPLAFRSDAARADFLGVTVDGVEVAPEHYTVREGSIIVELTAEYLKTLPAGEHTVVIRSVSGDAAATFTVEPAPFPFWIPVVAGAAMILALAVVLLLRKKKNGAAQ